MPIAMVVHLGDIVDNDATVQWNRADAAFDRLDACDTGAAPYLVTAGNHDLSLGLSERNSVGYFQHFNADPSLSSLGPDRWASYRCADPGDYYRFSESGLQVLCEKFERLDGGFNRGPASTMAELGVRFLAMLLCFNNRYLYFALRYAFKWPFFWFKYLDTFLARYHMAYDICSGSYFIGRKNGIHSEPAPLVAGVEQLQF